MFGIADDILVVGYDDDGRDHDKTVWKVLQRWSKVILKLNKDKCHFRCTSIPFFRQVISRNGVQPDPQKIKALMDMPLPIELHTCLPLPNQSAGLGKKTCINTCSAVSRSMLANSKAKQIFLSIFHSHYSSNILFRSSPHPNIYSATVSLCFFIYMCHKVSMCFTLPTGILTCLDTPVCLDALHMFGCPTVCLDAAKCMVASKGMRDIQTYGGHPNI